MPNPLVDGRNFPMELPFWGHPIFRFVQTHLLGISGNKSLATYHSSWHFFATWWEIDRNHTCWSTGIASANACDLQTNNTSFDAFNALLLISIWANFSQERTYESSVTKNTKDIERLVLLLGELWYYLESYHWQMREMILIYISISSKARETTSVDRPFLF